MWPFTSFFRVIGTLFCVDPARESGMPFGRGCVVRAGTVDRMVLGWNPVITERQNRAIFSSTFFSFMFKQGVHLRR